jgi:hypothetical protein
MAVTATVPGLPTTNGASLIQASTFALSAIADKVEHGDALDYIGRSGSSSFRGFPSTISKKNREMNRFYTRNNMTNGKENLSTLFWVKTLNLVTPLVPTNVVAGVQRVNLALKSTAVEVRAFHIISWQTSDGQQYSYTKRAGVEDEVFTNPETGEFMLPTSAYQCLYECVAFFFKPVAGTTPTNSGLFTLIGGRSSGLGL